MEKAIRTIITIALAIAVFHYHEVQASSSYWNQGNGAGSKYFWDYGRDAGSKYFWDYGRDAGSKYFWDYGTEAESLGGLKYVCYGLIVSKSTVPDICQIYPELEEMK